MYYLYYLLLLVEFVRQRATRDTRDFRGFWNLEATAEEKCIGPIPLYSSICGFSFGLYYLLLLVEFVRQRATRDTRDFRGFWNLEATAEEKCIGPIPLYSSICGFSFGLYYLLLLVEFVRQRATRDTRDFRGFWNLEATAFFTCERRRG